MLPITHKFAESLLSRAKNCKRVGKQPVVKAICEFADITTKRNMKLLNIFLLECMSLAIAQLNSKYK